MRNTFAKTFLELAKADERLCIVAADISPAGAMDEFRKTYPERFINTGVAEQIMIGMCAGMAMRGLKPFAYTIATFALYRPFEFVRDDLAYQNLPVTVVGIGGGVTYSQLGGTHHAMEDVAIACSIPNMQVIAPCDPYETHSATAWCTTNNGGPVYLRLGKAGEPVLSEDWGWQFGKLREIRHFSPSDKCVIGYGPILGIAMQSGIDVYSSHTLKPLDVAGINHLFKCYRTIIVLEEHVNYLGDKVKALAFEANYTGKIECMSLKDEFIHTYGTHDTLRAAHGLTKEELSARI